MNSKLLGVVAIFSMVACGDSGTGGAGGTGTGGSGGGTGAAGATGGSGGGTGAAGATGGSGGGDLAACTDACNTLYDCGVEGMNCPGFSGDPAEKMAFVGAAGEGTCIDGCLDQPLLIQLVDGENCAMTITSISGVSPDFADPCMNGFGGGGGAGGGM